MTEEWGPWIEHDGKGCPCVGKWVKVIYLDRHPHGDFESEPIEGCAISEPVDSWDWRHWPVASKILRYRIRKPRALIELIDMVESLPAPTERVEA